MIKNFMPSQTTTKICFNLDTFCFSFENTDGEYVRLFGMNELDQDLIRVAWRISTVDLMHTMNNMTIIRKSQKYKMGYDSGYILFRKYPKERYFKIWARPITPTHLIHCIDNGTTMNEAVKKVKMTKDSFKQWNRGKRPDYYGNYK